jgi:hypothetical protein
MVWRATKYFSFCPRVGATSRHLRTHSPMPDQLPAPSRERNRKNLFFGSFGTVFWQCVVILAFPATVAS